MSDSDEDWADVDASDEPVAMKLTLPPSATSSHPTANRQNSVSAPNVAGDDEMDDLDFPGSDSDLPLTVSTKFTGGAGTTYVADLDELEDDYDDSNNVVEGSAHAAAPVATSTPSSSSATRVSIVTTNYASATGTTPTTGTKPFAPPTPHPIKSSTLTPQSQPVNVLSPNVLLMDSSVASEFRQLRQESDYVVQQVTKLKSQHTRLEDILRECRTAEVKREQDIESLRQDLSRAETRHKISVWVGGSINVAVFITACALLCSVYFYLFETHPYYR